MDYLNILCWIVPAATSIVTGIIGYYWGKSSAESVSNCDEWIEKNRKLQVELDRSYQDLKTTKALITTSESQVSKDLLSTTAKTENSNSDLLFDPVAASTILGKKIKENDLTVIEGIGPKIAELLHENGIKTWYDLSKITVFNCQEILNAGGKSFEIHNPASWPMQAEMLFKSEWSKLAKWQEEHKGGRL